eukprot:909753-Amphidinium_carterae.1
MENLLIGAATANLANSHANSRSFQEVTSHAFAKALKGDAKLREEYKMQPSSKAKLEFKRKWDEANESAKRSKTQRQFQETGKAGQWKTECTICQTEGPEATRNIIKYCSEKGPGWVQWCPMREEYL